MPTFLFHVYNDDVTIDHEGQEHADLEAARQAAVEAARDLICEGVRRGQLVLSHRIEIEDGDGRPLLVVRFADAIILKD